MVQVCSRCRRSNPEGAVYCYHDGSLLDPRRAQADTLVRPLVFPSGATCRTIEGLSLALGQSWEEAVGMLRDGSLERLLRDSGRLDLARAAADAQTNPDSDLGLYQLLTRLPADSAPRPKLEVFPRRLILGPYPAGGQHQTHLSITNRGKGQLQGKLAIVDSVSWIRLDQDSDLRQRSLQVDAEESIPLWIDTRGLASGQTLGTRLIVVTGGGLAEVPVALEVTARPFPAPPFRAATSPRKLAELMRQHPREAAQALERGDVSHWFAENGWAYPVTGKSAQGMASVQQFFECLGLARPPQLELLPRLLHLVCVDDRPVQGELILRTPGKKWIFAQIESTPDWVRPASSTFSGPQQVTIPLEIYPRNLPAGISGGEIHLTANGGTRLRVPLHVEIRRAAPPVHRPRWVEALIVGAVSLLIFRLLAAIPADLLGRLFNPAIPDAGSLASWQTVPKTEQGFLSRFVLATGWLGSVLGVYLVSRRQGTWLDRIGGFIAGGGFGLAFFATLGCVIVVGDELPRQLLHHLGGEKAQLSWVLATMLWLMLVSGCWLVLGGILGLLCLIPGWPGELILGSLGTPIRWLNQLRKHKNGSNPPVRR